MNNALEITHVERQLLHWQRLVPLFLIIFIDSLAYFLVIPVLLRLFLNDASSLLPHDVSIRSRDLLYGTAISLSTFAFLLASPVVGHFSDKYGRKITMFYCLCAALIGFILPIIGIIKKYISLILIGRFIAGASTSSQPVAQAAIADFTFGKRKALYLSMIGFAMTLAMVLGPLGGGFLSDHALLHWFNVTTPYWVGVSLALGNIILLLLFFNDKGQIKSHRPHKNYFTQLKTLKTILFGNKIIGLLIVLLLIEIGWSQYYQAIFLFLTQQFHFSTDKIGLFTGYIGFWMSLGLTLIYRHLIRYLKVETILRMSVVLATIGLIGCLYIRTPLAQWIFVIPTSICVGTAYPSLLAIMSNHAPSDHQGWVLGSASTALAFAWMLTGFFSGILITLYLSLPLFVAAGFMLLGTILIWNLINNDNN